MKQTMRILSVLFSLCLLLSMSVFGSGEAGGPSGGPSGAPGGSGDMGGVTSYDAVLDLTEDESITGETLVSENGNENVIHVSNGASVSVTDCTIENSGVGSGGDAASFYGVGATLLVTDGSLYASDNTVSSTTGGGTGIFAYGDGTAYVSNCNISTTQGSAGGLHVAGGGTLYAWDCTVDTAAGMASAALRSDRGGGTMVVDGGRYVTNGGTGAVYVTADISVHDAYLYSGASEAIAIEGKNTLRLFDCDLSGNMVAGALNDGKVWNIIVYQSMSGDADVGTSEYDMIGGSLTCSAGPVVYNTNTSSYITFKNVDVTYGEDTTYWLQVTGNSSSRTWGNAGRNGAKCIFTADEQAMQGSVVYDTISSLDFYMLNGSELHGSVLCDDSLNGGYSGSGTADLYIDENSVWDVTGDSVITGTLYCSGTVSNAVIVDAAGKVIAGDDGAYTVTVGAFENYCDTTEAGSIPVWEDYAVENPFETSTPEAEAESLPSADSETLSLSDTADLLPVFTAEEVTSLLYIHNGETHEVFEVTDTDAISAVLNAISEITITGQTDEYVSDSGDILTFTTEDNTSLTLVFNGQNLESGSTLYTLEHTSPLWALLALLRTAES